MPEPEVVTDRLATAMQSLYAAAPDEFMAARSALVAAAKAAGDTPAATEIGKLRKPGLAAWAVNLAARVAPDVVASLTDLGSRMRAAQSRMDAGALTAVRGERDAAVDAFVRAASDAAGQSGRTLSTAALQDVRATAIAALADERAAAAVTSGQLTRALSYSGFGEVDLAEAVARTAGGAILTILPGGRGRRAGGGDAGRASGPEEGTEEGAQEGADDLAPDRGAGEDDEAEEVPSAEQLEEALALAERRLADAQAAVETARERAQDTRERLAVVERQLAKAREADERALEAVTDAVRARKQAEATRHTARQALDEASGRD
ncbi:hypothetical protein BJ986_001468 [Phycicoccus badiiscoriae]|uniref:Uncharacterized protein n=1 Tax=Pedococcus badiiscoriae TaxID=642776 RepID=A0A852WHF1_9MICO|nr:hypothetical protein [Pedococcus badiiscoriae]NYG06981.1 hypothetical protein [Pedococcus badiiscoriae]